MLGDVIVIYYVVNNHVAAFRGFELVRECRTIPSFHSFE
jgi:hypothetical protein